ncbi:MAG: hypothetical protein LBQ02_02240 [Candidatus Nomurabacteria bacterium]|jgi:hypothetical protein|nr:hypothetical protein [Candidatus Nomurabacteria bacterium]
MAGCKILVASEVAKTNRKSFSQIITDSYSLTDEVYNDYPKHFELFWTKYVPGIFKNERQIVAAYVDGCIAGVAILKKTARKPNYPPCTSQKSSAGKVSETAFLANLLDGWAQPNPLPASFGIGSTSSSGLSKNMIGC